MNTFNQFFSDEYAQKTIFIIISGIALFISFVNLFQSPLDPSWIAIVLCGLPILKEATIGLVTRFDIKADVLVSLALIAAVSIGELFAAGEIALIMAIGSLLEERTVAKARAGIEKLVQLTPQTARVIVDQTEQIIPALQVTTRETLRVLAGETIPVDGIIIKGQTTINQSIMTGEPIPIDKTAGDEVFSGTMNQFGTFEMRATKVGEDSAIQRMIRLVESADADKAKIVSLTDRWATWIVVIALISAAGTWWLTGEIIRAVTILVVFCPCALVLATPTAIMAGIGNATRYGILVREGDALERLANITRITFDKTGTLTYGKPTVTKVLSWHQHVDSETLLRLTAAVEQYSEHPLGKAIVRFKQDTVGPNDPTAIEPDHYQTLPGQGINAVIEGKRILVGNEHLMQANQIVMPAENKTKLSEYLVQGCTLIYVALDGISTGAIILSDTLRPDINTVIKQITNLGITPMLLTGDHRPAAMTIASQAGISSVQSDCLPETKMSVIKQYQRQGEKVCMIGDGINDAPALKTAHVGIAMGGIGSDIAIDAADAVLVSDEIQHLPHLLSLSRRMMKTIKINLIFSLLLNFIAIVLAMAGNLSPVAGALVHNAGSVLVIINSSMLLNWRKSVASPIKNAPKPAIQP